jgi:sarcosine oxidase, subunit beta
VAVTRDAGGLPARMPMTLFTRDGFHLRVRDGRVLLLRPSTAHEVAPEGVDDAWLDDVWAVARARVPTLSATELCRGDAWSGLYEMSPDGRAIVGRHPECDGLVLANGSSGHGVMHAPALGQIVAELIVHGEARCMDVRALRPSRFDEGDAPRSRGLL